MPSKTGSSISMTMGPPVRQDDEDGDESMARFEAFWFDSVE